MSLFPVLQDSCLLLVHFTDSCYLFAGLSTILDQYIGFLGQPRYVEHEICSMGQAVSWTTVLSPGMESGPESGQRI